MPKYTNNKFAAIDGYYGENQDFGGAYVPELLIPSLDELSETFEKYRNDPDFLTELEFYQTNFVGRPSPLIFAKNLTQKMGGAKIYLKNEGNNLTGSHKINHCLYQALLALRMGKTEIICETGAGQHGIASATVCAKFGLKCKVFMGQKDIDKQYPNVFFMRQMGAEVVAVTDGSQTLVNAVDAAIGEFLANPESYYMLGSAVGPAPYPEIMREAQRIISVETKKQLAELENKLPDVVVACIGGGSNAIGAFGEYLCEDVRLIGVEAGGLGVEERQQDILKNVTLGKENLEEKRNEIGISKISESTYQEKLTKVDKNSNRLKHASRVASGLGTIGVMQGFKSYFLLDKNGQNMSTQTIASGLNYAGIGPIHAYLHSIGRLEITSATDAEVLEAFQLLAKSEGIIAALESCHAVVEALKIAPKMSQDQIILVNLSGRGDNYLFNLAKGLQDAEFEKFCQKFDLSE